jgi:MFS family permease
VHETVSSEIPLDAGNPARSRGHLTAAIFAHALLRIGASADGTLVGLYLAYLGRTHAGIDVRTAGLLGATAYGAELCASLPLGLAADVLSARGLMLLGSLMSAMGTGLFALTARTPIFLVSRLMQGAGIAGVTPPLLTVLARGAIQAPIRRARLMSLFELSMLAGLALGGLAASGLWVRMREGAFGILALAAAGCGVFLFASTPPQSGEGVSPALRGLQEVLKDRFVRALAPVWVCVNAVIGLWLGPTLVFLLTEQSHGGQYLVGRFSAAPAHIGWLMLSYTALFGLGVSLWSFVLPRFSFYAALRVSLLAMLGVCFVLFALNHSVGGVGIARGALLLAAALLILVESGFTPAALTWLAASLERLGGKGAAMGLYSVLLGLGAVIGSLLGAVLGEVWQVDGLLLGTLILALVALWLLRSLGSAGTESHAVSQAPARKQHAPGNVRRDG